MDRSNVASINSVGSSGKSLRSNMPLIAKVESKVSEVGPDAAGSGCGGVGVGKLSAPEEQAARKTAMAGTASQDNPHQRDRRRLDLDDNLKGPILN